MRMDAQEMHDRKVWGKRLSKPEPGSRSVLEDLLQRNSLSSDLGLPPTLLGKGESEIRDAAGITPESAELADDLGF